jgi:hypothetical protein
MSADLVRDRHIGLKVAPVVVEDVVQDGLSRVREGSVGFSHRRMLGAIPRYLHAGFVRAANRRLAIVRVTNPKMDLIWRVAGLLGCDC